MEYMKYISAVLVFVISVEFYESNCQPAASNDAGQGQEELRSMLNIVLEQNRRLTLQNKRLQQVWSGMEQMCKALSMPTCDCEPDVPENRTTDPAPAPIKQAKRKLTLHVMSVKSSGTNKNQTTISIKYAATPDHTTDWIMSRSNDGMWRTAGQRTRDTYDPVVYTSTVEIVNLGSLRNLDFRLYNTDRGLSVQLNITSMEANQVQDIEKPDVDLLKINESFVAPRDGDLVITGIVNRDPREFHELAYIDVFFTGLNTSASPPTIFEIMPFNSEGLTLKDGRYNDTTSYMNITLRQPYVQYGGLLSIRMPYIDNKSNMIERILYGPLVRIYRPDGKNIIQENAVGMFPLDAETVVFPSNHSIMCAAMGNPRPEASIFKMTKNGKKTKMTTETVISDSYTDIKVMTLSASQPKQTEGRYLCQATNGNQTINSTTEVVVLEEAVFDEAKTGVTKNSSQSIVISCKAKGKPKPYLELRLFEEYGPDLIKSGMYKFRKSNPNMFTTRVTLTISPVDDSDIHNVYCASTQGGPSRSYEDRTPIYVYPGVHKENNWDLYDRVMNATQRAYSG